MKFYDKKGIEIREFAVIKIFHYTGPRRRKYYMYKWIKIENGNYVAYHLTDRTGSFWLKAIADEKGTVDCEVVQDYSQPYQDY